MSQVYFVTHRTSKYPPEKNAVMGEYDRDDTWVVTDHYDSEEKMINAVFETIIDNETLDCMLEDVKTSSDGLSNKAEVQKAKKESDKLYNKLVNLFPTIGLEYGDDCKKRHRDFNKTCKQMTLENKKKFIEIVKQYYSDQFPTWVGIAYGVTKVK